MNNNKKHPLTVASLLLACIDSGAFFRKPFSWLYVMFAALNALLPIFIVYKASKSGFFRYGGKLREPVL
jgi:hypothetical protein